MKIMVIEDRGTVCDQLVLKLEEQKWEVAVCTSTNQADATWNANKNKIDVLIFDICMSHQYLPDDLKKETHLGYITGWIWFWKKLYVNKMQPHPFSGKKIIVFSGYLDTLAVYMESEEADKAEKEFYYNHVVSVGKGNFGSYKEIIQYINERATK